MVFFSRKLPPPPLEILTCGRALERALFPLEWPVLPRKARKVNMVELRRLAQVERLSLSAPEDAGRRRKHDAAVMLQRAVRSRTVRTPRHRPALRPLPPLKLSLEPKKLEASRTLSRATKRQLASSGRAGPDHERGLHERRLYERRLHERRLREESEAMLSSPMRVADVEALRKYYRARERAALAQLERLQDQEHRRHLAASARNSSWFRSQQRSKVSETRFEKSDSTACISRCTGHAMTSGCVCC